LNNELWEFGSADRKRVLIFTTSAAVQSDSEPDLAVPLNDTKRYDTMRHTILRLSIVRDRMIARFEIRVG
jgi:hypothetical protein